MIRPERSRALDDARTRLTAAREAWTRPTAAAGASYRDYGSIDTNYFGDVEYDRYGADQPLAPTQIDDMLHAIDGIRVKLDANTANRNDERYLTSLRPYVVFVVAERETEPQVQATPSTIASYSPATLAGTAYLSSLPQGRITCAGEIDVESPEHIEFRSSYMEGNPSDREAKMVESAKAVLHRDIEVQVRQAIARGLRAVP